MRLEWTHKAIGDLREAGEYIALDNVEAARRMATRIIEAVEYLIDHPNLGRPGDSPAHANWLFPAPRSSLFTGFEAPPSRS